MFLNEKALITGISGQDGSYLAEYLIELGYEVFGIVRRQYVAENQSSRIQMINDQVKTFYGDLNDESSLFKLLKKIKPDEIYNLAAMSHVKVSFDVPSYTIKTNALGVLNILEAYKESCPNSRLYQASSSEMFGNSIDNDGCQRLSTPMNPVSPYGCSKILGFNLVKHYRNAYNLHCCNGILFNHESPRRGTNFVTHKIVKGAVEIKKVLKVELILGNLDSSRDWGHSYDYVRAMHLILNHPDPRDWIVSTGETRTVRQLCDYVFKKLGLDYKDFIKQDKKYMRPEELDYLKGDSRKALKDLNFKFKYNIKDLVKEMLDSDIEKAKKA